MASEGPPICRAYLLLVSSHSSSLRALSSSHVDRSSSIWISVQARLSSLEPVLQDLRSNTARTFYWILVIVFMEALLAAWIYVCIIANTSCKLWYRESRSYWLASCYCTCRFIIAYIISVSSLLYCLLSSLIWDLLFFKCFLGFASLSLLLLSPSPLGGKLYAFLL